MAEGRPSAAWASGEAAAGAAEEEPQTPVVSFEVESFGETKLRYFAVEFVGAFMQALLTDLFRWTEHYQYADSFKVVNPGGAPTVSIECLQVRPNASSCEGPISNPLAGSTLPRNYMFNCLADGLSFICCCMSAPGATILPQFAILFCLVGLKEPNTFVPSILGQFAGVALANFLVYLLLRTAIDFQTTIFMMTTAEVEDLVEYLFGMSYPADDVSNQYALLYACLSGVMLVFLLTPMLHRCMGMHPLAQDCAKGVAICVFQAGFGQNGLGSMPNPTQWVVTAMYLHAFDIHVWRKHDYYALIVPFWGPVLGVMAGALLYRVYMGLLHFGKVELPHVSPERRTKPRGYAYGCP